MFMVMSQIFLNRFSSDPDTKAPIIANRGSYEMNIYSTRILDYLVPTLGQHYVKGEYAKNLLNFINQQKSNWVEQANFIGFTPLILLLWSIFAYKRSQKYGGDADSIQWQFWTRTFLTLAAVMFFASFPANIHIQFGPVVTAKDGFFRGDFTTPIGMIYGLFPMFRAIVRSSIFVQLCVSVLAALVLFKGLERFKPGILVKIIVFTVIGGSILLDFWPRHTPFTMDTTATHPGYQWIKEQPKSDIVIEYPLFPAYPKEYEYYYNMWFHDHPIANFLPGRYPFITEFNEIISNIYNPVTVDFLREIGVKHVIWHSKTEIQPLPAGLAQKKSFPGKSLWIYSIDGDSSYLSPVDLGNRHKTKETFKKLLGFRICSPPECIDIDFTSKQSFSSTGIHFSNQYKTFYPTVPDGNPATIIYKFLPDKDFKQLYLKYALYHPGNGLKVLIKEQGESNFRRVLVDEGTSKFKIVSTIIQGFKPNLEYEIVFEMVSKNLPWDARIESIRKYHQNTDTDRTPIINIDEIQ